MGNWKRSNAGGGLGAQRVTKYPDTEGHGDLHGSKVTVLAVANRGLQTFWTMNTEWSTQTFH